MRKYINHSSAKVETLYRAWIEWNSHEHRTEHISKQVSKLKHSKYLDITDNGGGPCWNSYFIITGRNQKEVQNFSNKVLRLLNRYKDVEIVDA